MLAHDGRSHYGHGDHMIWRSHAAYERALLSCSTRFLMHIADSYDLCM